MARENAIKLFQGQNVHVLWDEEQEKWFFSIIDVVGILTENVNPTAYWKKLKLRFKAEGNQTVTIRHGLKMIAPDGKIRMTDVAETEQLFRLIRFIPSLKAEPFKLWLAKVASERIDNMQDPEVGGDKAFDWNKGFPQVFMKKKKKAWHVTTALHNSRYSQRMFDNHVKLGDVIRLEEKDEILITEIVADIVKEDNLNVIEYNICGDHMHLLIVCEKEELPKIVGKIKAKSGRKYNIENGITRGPVPLSSGPVPLSSGPVPLSSGPVPLSLGNGPSSGRNLPSKNIENNTGKKKYNSLWTQKFGKSEIRDEKYLNNAIAYIRNNRIKHNLPGSERIEKIKKEFLCTKEHAFRTEYEGEFDMVVGNPPYVNANDLKKGLTEKADKILSLNKQRHPPAPTPFRGEE